MSEKNAADFFTAAVWCVPFSGAVGLFNKLQTQKKTKKKAFKSVQNCAVSAGEGNVVYKSIPAAFGLLGDAQASARFGGG